MLSGCNPEDALKCVDVPAHFPAESTVINGYLRGSWISSKNPILSKSVDPAWNDSGYVFAPVVVYDDIFDRYHTYYMGDMPWMPGMGNQRGHSAFMLAVSDTPISERTKIYGDGLRGANIELGLEGYFDYDRAWGGGTVLHENGTFKVWYTGDSDARSGHIARVGYAESQDGKHWVKRYADTPTGAIFEDMTGCHPTAYPLAGIYRFSVTHSDDGYYAFYNVFNSEDIRLAFSKDGISNWQTLGAINVPFPGTKWIGSVTKIDSVYYLAVTAVPINPDVVQDTTIVRRIVILASNDKKNWSLYDEIKSDGEISHPFLFNDNGELLLFYAHRNHRLDPNDFIAWDIYVATKNE